MMLTFQVVYISSWRKKFQASLGSSYAHIYFINERMTVLASWNVDVCVKLNDEYKKCVSRCLEHEYEEKFAF